MNPTPPELVIFDCDGVLVDSEGPASEVMAQYFTSLGIALEASEIHGLFVGGTLKSVGGELRMRGHHLPDTWFEALLSRVIARMEEGVDLIEGVETLISKLESANIATAIVSNGSVEKMQASLGPHGLFDKFSGRIFSGYVHGAPKPAPDLVRLAMSRAGTVSSRTIMIDDSPAGCRAAVAAGVRCFGYAVEGQGDALGAVGAEVVSSMRDIEIAIGL